MNLTVGQIVWARCNKIDIYWPGKITFLSNNTNESWSSGLFDNYQRQVHYYVQFYVTNQSIWTTDILPYRQYRDCMTNDSFIHYGLHPTMKPDFLNAIHQADYYSNNEMCTNSNQSTSMIMITSQHQTNLFSKMENNIDNDFLLASSPMVTSNTGD